MIKFLRSRESGAKTENRLLSSNGFRQSRNSEASSPDRPTVYLGLCAKHDTRSAQLALCSRRCSHCSHASTLRDPATRHPPAARSVWQFSFAVPSSGPKMFNNFSQYILILCDLMTFCEFQYSKIHAFYYFTLQKCPNM